MKSRKLREATWIQRVISILYGIVGVTLFMLPIAFIYYKITFQSILLATNFIPLTIVLLTRLSPTTGSIPRRFKVSFCTSAFLTLCFIVIASINPITILLSECPNSEPPPLPCHHHHHHHERDISDELLLNLWVRNICENEQGFIIVYLVYMLLLFMLNLVSLFIYAFRITDE